MIINFNFFNTKFSAQNTTKRNIKSGNADNQPNIYFHAHKNLRSPQKNTVTMQSGPFTIYLYSHLYHNDKNLYIRASF